MEKIYFICNYNNDEITGDFMIQKLYNIVLFNI